MNIGIFTDTYYPQIDGVTTSVRMLETELRKLGHTVYIFTIADPRVAGRSPDVFRLPSMKLFFLKSKRLALVYPPKLLFKMKSLKLDVVHTQTEFTLGILGKIVSEVMKIPQIHTYHTMYEDYVHYIANGHLITPGAARRISAFFCNRSDAVIAPAKKTKTSLLEYGVKRPIDIIPTGIDFSHFERGENTERDVAELKKSLNIAEDIPVVLYVGRLAVEKSADVVIKQFAELRKIMPAKLLIVGDGPVKGELEQLCLDLNIENDAVFTGAVPWTDIAVYYAAGDVFITASVTETQGLTYVEAMASGVVVAAKKDKAAEDILFDGETGYEFESDEQARDVLVKALTDKENAERIRENALDIIKPLSSAVFGENVEALYIRAIEEFKNRPPKERRAVKRIKSGTHRLKERLRGVVKIRIFGRAFRHRKGERL